jgi:hypothetical protein
LLSLAGLVGRLPLGVNVGEFVGAHGRLLSKGTDRVEGWVWLSLSSYVSCDGDSVLFIFLPCERTQLPTFLQGAFGRASIYLFNPYLFTPNPRFFVFLETCHVIGVNFTFG